MNRSQIVIGSQKYRDPRSKPYAFTEQGVAMLSSVLRSKRAITVNIEIMRAFVKLRQLFVSNTELAHRLDKLESKYDKQFKIVFVAIQQLMAKPVKDRKEIGFRSRSDQDTAALARSALANISYKSSDPVLKERIRRVL